jgi:uncharacterized protein YciI
LAEPIKEGERPKMTGSILIAQADTEAEVREILEKDIYIESGVWNWEKVQITPVSHVQFVGKCTRDKANLVCRSRLL